MRFLRNVGPSIKAGEDLDTAPKLHALMIRVIDFCVCILILRFSSACGTWANGRASSLDDVRRKKKEMSGVLS